MAQQTKKQKAMLAQLGDKQNASHSPENAIKILQEVSTRKFGETLDLVIKLGIDARKGDEMVRGVVTLPSGSGKEIRIAVFAEGEDATGAKEAGADAVGTDELAQSMEKGELNYDVVIATPATMKIVGRLGRILGPKGLMPSPKDGTVSENVKETVNAAKSGQARFRNDKGGIIHCGIGKLKSDGAKLLENYYAVINEIQRLKPQGSKGIYLKKIVLSSTMGPGLEISTENLR